MKRSQALEFVRKHGALLVYPLANKKEPLSLWSLFFPRSQMKWEWDSGADSRVSDLWFLREELSRSNEVVYAKWFRGRATFFSRPVAEAVIGFLDSDGIAAKSLMSDSRLIYETLLDASPQSTKSLRKNLRSHISSQSFDRAQRPLWESLLIAGQGEVDDGAFPSLSVGATKHLHEGVWRRGAGLPAKKAEGVLSELLTGTPFLEFAKRLKRRQEPRIPSKKTNKKQVVILGSDLSLFSMPTLIKPR